MKKLKKRFADFRYYLKRGYGLLQSWRLARMTL
jgi:hypothetical protein